MNYKILKIIFFQLSVQFSSVAQSSCSTLCDPMNCSTPGLPVHHQLLEFAQTHVHRVSDAFQPSHPLSSPSPPAPNPSQHQSLFQWVNSSHEVALIITIFIILILSSLYLKTCFLGYFFLSWRIIALQWCVSFCCTTKWISCKYTYMSFLLSLPPTSSYPIPLGHHRALSWTPCAIQQLPTICFTHGSVFTYMCVCVCVSLIVSDSLQPHGL